MNVLRRFLALGVIVGPLPNNIVNGTVEDATQVMGNFNWIVSQVNANASAGSGTITRNILLNGAMDVSQRFVATTSTLAAVKGYTLDRWQGQSGVGSSAGFSQITGIGLNQFEHALRVQRTAGNTATTTIYLAQSLETIDTYQMQGQTITLSFWARAGANYSALLNLLQATITTGTGTDENVLIGYTGSSSIVTNFNITNNWIRYQVSLSVPATATELGLVFTFNPSGTAGTNDYFDVTGVQIELSPSASNYDFRPFVETYQKCLRYYQKTFGYPFVPAQNTSNGNYVAFIATIAGATNNYSGTVLYPVAMRQTPTATLYNPYAANANIRNVTQSSDFTITNSGAGVLAIRPYGTAPVGTLVGDLCAVHYSLDAEL